MRLPCLTAKLSLAVQTHESGGKKRNKIVNWAFEWLFALGSNQVLRGCELTSSVTIIGQRDVRCWKEIRSRRTRNIRKIWAETKALGFMRRVSVNRSERRERPQSALFQPLYWTYVHTVISQYRTLDEGQIEVILVEFSAEHGERLALQQHGFLVCISKQFQGAALHAYSTHTAL